MRIQFRVATRAGLLAGAGLVSLFAGQALAAMPDPDAPAAVAKSAGTPQEQPAVRDDNEIVVTAQKRSENAQDVPIAITALDSAQLSATGIADTETLRAAVPSLNVTTATGGFGLPRIRGVGATGQGPGIENPVAVYVDGVYYGSAFGVLQSLFDAEQVAVLKGPQGTLFGRNATGGLIQITTVSPEYAWNGKAEVGYGNYKTIDGAAYVSGGLSDTVSMSLSGQYQNRADGYGRNLFTGNDVQNDKTWTMRGKLKFEPGPDTSILLSGDFNGRNSANPAFSNFGLNTLGQNIPTQIRGLGGDPEYDINADVDPYLRARQWGTSVTVDQGIGSASLKSITAYRNSKLRTRFDPDGTTVQSLVIDNHQFDKQFTQEFNLLSSDTRAFKWVVGLFYLHDEAGFDAARTTGTNVFGNNGYRDNYATVELDSYSGFAEGTFSLGKSTNITAGIRYTSDHRKFSGSTVEFNGATNATTTTPAASQALTFNKPSWRLSIDHRLSPELLVYASYNRGFRAGTFVPQVSPVTVLQPELVDAYEVGLKSDLLDRHVRVNLAGYYFDQSSVQVMQVIAGTQFVYNAKGARIYGVDGDVTVKITPNFRVFGGFNLTDARYKDFTDAVISIPFPVGSTFSTTQYTYKDSVTGNTVANTVCLGTFLPPTVTSQPARDGFYRGRTGGNCLLRGDASGNRLQNTPEFTFSVGSSLDIPTESIGTFKLAGNYYFNGGYVGTPDERVRQASFNTLDASLTWSAPDEKLYVKAWARNLTDAYYRSQIGATNSGDNGYAGAPRTYGLSAGVKF